MKFPTEMLGQHLAIVGKAGSGKTYAAKGLVEHLLAKKRRVCILDPTGVWYGLRSSPDGKRAGYPVAVFGGPRADVAIADQFGAALAHLVATKNLPVIVDLSEMLIGQRHRFVTDFCEALYRDNRAALHLVIDEADEFCPQNPLPETKRMLHHVDRIVRRGRVRGFRVTLITQRPAVLHKNVLTQANTLIAMRLTAPQDRSAIKAWVDGQADAVQGKAVLDSLASLPRGEGWVWAPELGFLERVPFPRITTFDSSRAPEDNEVAVEPTKLAAVDLAEIKASFAAVEQEARTLVELKAEVAELKRKVAAAEKARGGAGVPEAEVQRRIDAAVRAAKAATPPAGQSASKALLAGIEKIAAGLQVVQAELAGVAPSIVPRARTVAAATRPSVAFERQAAPAVPAASVGGLRSGAVRILQELAARAPAGYSRPQVGALTLGASVPATPKTHDEVMQLWRRALRSGAFAMLEAIVRAGSDGASRAAVAAEVGMLPTGGPFGTYLSDLRRNGLITDTGGRCVANDILFPKGGR